LTLLLGKCEGILTCKNLIQSQMFSVGARSPNCSNSRKERQWNKKRALYKAVCSCKIKQNKTKKHRQSYRHADPRRRQQHTAIRLATIRPWRFS